jgi:hypothetical protein
LAEYERCFTSSGSGPGHTHHTGEVKVWDISTRRELLTLGNYKEWVYKLAFAPDGLTIATASTYTTIRLWTGATDDEIVDYYEQLQALNPGNTALAIKMAGAYWGLACKPRAGNETGARTVLDALRKGRKLLAELYAASLLNKEQSAWIAEFDKALNEAAACGDGSTTVVSATR